MRLTNFANSRRDRETGTSKTISGFGDAPDGFTNVTVQDVLDLSKQIGHPPIAAGAADYGTPGGFYASHAEQKAAVVDTVNPKIITYEGGPCWNCQRFYQKLADYTGHPQEIHYPNDGYIRFDPQ